MEMTIILTCDLCKNTLEIPPGEHSMHYNPTNTPGSGWKWIQPASFQSSFRIFEETICSDCLAIIKEAKENAEITTRKALKQ
jgi:hypothetical protein